MAGTVQDTVRRAVERHGHDRGRLLPILQHVQLEQGWIADDAVTLIAQALGMPQVDVADTASFYHLLRRTPGAGVIIRLSTCPMCATADAPRVLEAFARALQHTPDGASPAGDIALGWTACLGMCDQGPAALVNGHTFTRLLPEDVPGFVDALRGARRGRLPGTLASGPLRMLPYARVASSHLHPGPVLLQPVRRGAGLWQALTRAPEKVIDEIARSRLRGRGGAGFPTANKWKFTRQATGGAPRYVICNADEGEPGTFKDRVLLTEAPDLVIEGMTIAAYAIGAAEGIVYLRAEYAFLLERLEQVLAERRRLGLLGPHICGNEAFTFDIRIQLGAGAYVCGEETALLESLEGRRGAPWARPPFPTDRGYLGRPTAVDNVETFACATRIIERDGTWFAGFGTRESTGTKLMSLAGDCERPGVYEVPWGTSVHDLLDLAGGADAQAVQVGGPSGQCVAPKDFGRLLAYEDLSTNGSTMVFGPRRDLLAVMRGFQAFFAHESCGWCTPCRVGTALMVQMLDRVLAGRGTARDLEELVALAGTVKRTSRCGLGQAAGNPILSTARNFPDLYDERLQSDAFVPRVRLEEALRAATAVQGPGHHAAEGRR